MLASELTSVSQLADAPSLCCSAADSDKINGPNSVTFTRRPRPPFWVNLSRSKGTFFCPFFKMHPGCFACTPLATMVPSSVGFWRSAAVVLGRDRGLCASVERSIPAVRAWMCAGAQPPPLLIACVLLSAVPCPPSPPIILILLVFFIVKPPKWRV